MSQPYEMQDEQPGPPGGYFLGRDRYCHDCGYNLRSAPEPRCPECGRPFDHEDPRTVHDPYAPRWRTSIFGLSMPAALGFVSLFGLGWLTLTLMFHGGFASTGMPCCLTVLLAPLWMLKLTILGLRVLPPSWTDSTLMSVSLGGVIAIGSIVALMAALGIAAPPATAVVAWLGLPLIACGMMAGLIHQHLELTGL